MQDASLHQHYVTAHGAGTGMHGGQPKWEDVYASTPRWDIGRPQPAFQALAEMGAIGGRGLDVGCGNGEHVLMCAGLGLQATGVDLAATAIHTAQQKAHQRGLNARFLRHDARHLGELAESFDTVLDSGLFVHVVNDPGDCGAYLHGLRTVVPPGGRYFLLCFSGPQPDSRARRLMREEIAGYFTDTWRLDSIEPATLDSLTDPDGIPAWLVTLARS